MNTPSLTISARGESNIEPVPEGLHDAICCGLYYVGTIYSEQFDRAHKKLVISWELPNCPPLRRDKDGKTELLPRVVSRRLTMSLHEKSLLRPLLEGWRGKKFTEVELANFDVAKVLASPCQVQVLHETGREGQPYANVQNVLPAARDGKRVGSLPPRFFSVANLDQPVLPGDLPPWIGKIVQQSREWEKLVAKEQNPTGPVPDADEPAETPAQDYVPF